MGILICQCTIDHKGSQKYLQMQNHLKLEIKILAKSYMIQINKLLRKEQKILKNM